MHIVPQTIMRETTLLGTEVTNFQSETLGRIRDFVISDNGNIPYAITEVNDRWCFIPTTALTIDRFHRLALVDIPQKRLTALASFEPGALPDLNISNWDMEIRAFWLSELGLKANEMSPNLIISETPAMTAKRTQNFLASAIREYTVRGSKGETLGGIEDLMLNMEEADAAYIVIGVGGFLDIGEKLFPIPVEAVSIMTGKDVVLNIDRKMLEQAPGFTNNEWLIMENSEQRKKVSDYWKNILR
jgi:sporulation protein YlmC with PRC-barrel domain